jgi:hypothetical protein
MAIDIERKFLEGLAKREAELARQREAELAERQRAAESETEAIPERPRIPAEQRIRRAIGRIFPQGGRGDLK